MSGEFEDTPMLERFRVNPLTGCWIFLGTIDADGYGRAGSGVAHRFFYESLRGPVPEALELDHLCVRRVCVNPDHLEPVTQDENRRRGELYRRPSAWRRTTCKRGHEINDTNSVLEPFTKPNGVTYVGRRCIICRRMARQQRSASKPVGP